jgi:hypothetical protein
MKKLVYFIFGKRAEGQALAQPTFKVVLPANRPSLNEWVAEFKFGSRYGHRGTFYSQK